MNGKIVVSIRRGTVDDLARKFYELIFKDAFRERRGEGFQDLFSAIMEKRYPGDFQRIRPWGPQGDRKNDGYWRSQRTLFQCYAPNELSAAICIAKINEDFTGALPYWKQHFDTWVFVHNAKDGLGPEVMRRLLELEKKHKPMKVTAWGFEELRQQVFGLPESELASLLGPAPSRQTMVELGLPDLAPVLDQIARLPPADAPDLRPVPADKLERNLLSSSVALLLHTGMAKAGLVRKYFVRKPALQDQIAESFRQGYARLREGTDSPDDVFVALQRFAGGGELPSPARQAAVLAVLAFFFEECDIFDRPQASEPP